MDANNTNVIQFKNKCDMCVHLGYDGVCNERVYEDNEPIIPVKNGKHTSDYYACGGEAFELRRRLTWQKKMKRQVGNQ